MKKIALIVVLVAACLLFAPIPGVLADAAHSPVNTQAIASAFEQHRRNVEVEGQGTVSRVLPDDRDGIWHQKFIVQIDHGPSVLIAHNIDLAPRVEGIRRGDRIAFYGEYEWNPKGGVVHWTHRDPHGWHAAGWIKHNGNTYQ